MNTALVCPNKVHKNNKKALTAAFVLVVLVLSSAAAGYHFVYNTATDSNENATTATNSIDPLLLSKFASPVNATAPGRVIFPYSVIPGGATNSRELQDALRQDSVAARHYAGFDAGSARVVKLAANQQAYVSYRLGEHIYWTRKKVTLHAGETVLTDGAHLARARCGNRVSEVPGPTNPAEPPEQLLDKPVLHFPEVTPDGSPIAPIWVDQPASPIFFAGLTSPQGAVPGPGIVPPFFPIACCGKTSNSPSQSTVPSTPGPPNSPLPGPPPVTTPEPGTLLLLSFGLLGIAVILLRRN